MIQADLYPLKKGEEILKYADLISLFNFQYNLSLINLNQTSDKKKPLTLHR